MHLYNCISFLILVQSAGGVAVVRSVTTHRQPQRRFLSPAFLLLLLLVPFLSFLVSFPFFIRPISLSLSLSLLFIFSLSFCLYSMQRRRTRICVSTRTHHPADASRPTDAPPPSGIIVGCSMRRPHQALPQKDTSNRPILDLFSDESGAIYRAISSRGK